MIDAGFYSFKVWATEEVIFPEHFLVLGEGENIFNTSVEDIEAFRQKLVAAGVRIIEEHCLDDDLDEEVPPVTMDCEALPRGEGPWSLSLETSTRHDRGGRPAPRALSRQGRNTP